VNRTIVFKNGVNVDYDKMYVRFRDGRRVYLFYTESGEPSGSLVLAQDNPLLLEQFYNFEDSSLLRANL
jgi:hypothetical protein